MPISVPSSCTPGKQLQFLHIVTGSSVDERIDGKLTPDLFCMQKWSTLALKATFMKLKNNMSCIIFKSRLSVFWFLVVCFFRKASSTKASYCPPASELSKTGFWKRTQFQPWHRWLLALRNLFLFLSRLKASTENVLLPATTSPYSINLKTLKKEAPAKLGYSCSFPQYVLSSVPQKMKGAHLFDTVLITAFLPQF